jgi:hypothetical protein
LTVLAPLQTLADSPADVNKHAESTAWFVKLEVSSPGERECRGGGCEGGGSFGAASRWPVGGMSMAEKLLS